MVEHKVRKGDTQIKYKEVFGVEWDELKIANPDLKRLTPMKTIKLPITKKQYEQGCEQLYKQGESLVEQAKEEQKTNETNEVKENTTQEIKSEIKEKYKYIVNTTRAASVLNVREYPTLTSKIIRTYGKGIVLYGEEVDGWLKLNNGGYCILSKLLKVEDESPKK